MTYTQATKGPWINEPSTDTEWKWWIEVGTLFLTFRGSTSRMDWRQNFSFWVKPYKNQSVTWFAHAGFVKKYKSVRDEVLKLVKDSEVTRVEVGGFSQGGAVAILCFEDLRFHYPFYSIKCTTYGAPRVVWFWNRFKIHNRFIGINRHQIRSDIVPKLPPKLFGYRDVGGCLPTGKKRFSFPWQWKKIHMSYKEEMRA